MATMLMLGVIGSSLTATGDEPFPTMVAIIVVCSLATAASALLIAHFKLADLVRFIPYPVSSGFLAGTGGIACWLALSLMGIRPEAEALATLFEPLVAANWGIGIVYGFGLYFATQRWKSILPMPVSFAVVAGLCHAGLMASGTGGAEAGAAGFLLAGLSDATLWPPVWKSRPTGSWTGTASSAPSGSAVPWRVSAAVRRAARWSPRRWAASCSRSTCAARGFLIPLVVSLAAGLIFASFGILLLLPAVMVLVERLRSMLPGQAGQPVAAPTS